MTAEEWMDRGEAARDAGDLEAALAHFTEAVRLEPGEVYNRVTRGNLLGDLGRFEEAAADFRAALELEEEYPAGLRYNLGNALYNLGRHVEALAEYDEAVRFDPTFGWGHHGRGHTLNALGRHVESLAAYEEAVRLLPGNALPANGRAVALAELGRHEEALAAFDETLQLDPNFESARSNRALLLDKVKRSTPTGGQPSEKMKRLYHRFSELCGGESEDLWVFDPDELPKPAPFLGVTHVMAWPANDDCDVTSFQSLGMSDRRMAGADYYCEVAFAVRAALTEEQRLQVARWVANVCAYPFQFELKLDWWELIRDPGRIPGFTGCKHLLLHPRLAPEGYDTVEDEAGPVKVLWLVPITPWERQLLLDIGRAALVDHLAENEIDVLIDRSDPAE